MFDIQVSYPFSDVEAPERAISTACSLACVGEWVEIQPGGLKKNFFRFPDKSWSCQYHFYCDFIFNLWKKNQFHDANIKKWVSQI